MDTNADITFADKEFTAKNYDQAEKLYTNLIEKSNDLNCDLFLKRSECYFKLGKYQNSFDDAQILVEHKPDMTHAFYLCGRALSKMERFEEALSLYKQGLELDPKDPYLTEGLKSMQNDVVNSYEKKGGESTYNAVKMSSRDPYPGDDELEKMEKEILTKWGILEFPDIILMVPDQQKALKEFQRALQFMKAGNNSQAIEKIQVRFHFLDGMLWSEPRHSVSYTVVCICAQRRLRSACASPQSDQSSMSAWRRFESLATLSVPCKDSDQNARMRSLIWVFAWRTCNLVGNAVPGFNGELWCNNGTGHQK